jgi:hypothetical protein
MTPLPCRTCLHFPLVEFHPSEAWPFLNVMLSINAIRGRLRKIRVNNWIMAAWSLTRQPATMGGFRAGFELYLIVDFGRLLHQVSRI